MIINTHPKIFIPLIISHQDVLSHAEMSFLYNEAIGQNTTNMLVYLLNIKMVNSPSGRLQFNKVLGTSRYFTVLQKSGMNLVRFFNHKLNVLLFFKRTF